MLDMDILRNRKDDFLFEHKSYIRKDISFQLLRYMVEIWETKIRKEKNYELPVVMPLVIYHGKEDWNIKNYTRRNDNRL